jgi:dephospho-CoA kinase
MSKKVIGVVGKIGSGKDTVADYFVNNHDYMKYSFAIPIKDIAVNIFGFTTEQVNDHLLKEIKDDFWDITPRKFLQIVGTDMFREIFRQDVWVKMAERNITNTQKNIIIPDIRFENEAKLVKEKYNGTIIKIIRNNSLSSTKARQHKSEKGVNDDYIDFTIDNNYDMNTLTENLKRISNKI